LIHFIKLLVSFSRYRLEWQLWQGGSVMMGAPNKNK